MPNYQQIAMDAASKAGIPPELFAKQIKMESGFDPNAKSPAGAIGIAQIVPKYHPEVNPKDPIASLNWAAQYMARQYHKYGNYQDALSVYNSGRPWSQGQSIGETNHYVNSILGGSRASLAKYSATGQMPNLADPPGPSKTASLLINYLMNSNKALASGGQAPSILATMQAIQKSQNTQQPSVHSPLQTLTQDTTPSHSGSSINWIEHFAAPFGLSVTSTNGGKHTEHSFHYQNRAVDFGGNSGGMSALAKAALHDPSQITEMFYTGPGNPGYFIKNGQVYPNNELDSGLAAEHTNHVHIAR